MTLNLIRSRNACNRIFQLTRRKNVTLHCRTVGLPFAFCDVSLAERRMPLARKRIFRIPAPAPTTIYVRPGYNRVLAEEFEGQWRELA